MRHSRDPKGQEKALGRCHSASSLQQLPGELLCSYPTRGWSDAPCPPAPVPKLPLKPKTNRTTFLPALMAGLGQAYIRYRLPDSGLNAINFSPALLRFWNCWKPDMLCAAQTDLQPAPMEGRGWCSPLSPLNEQQRSFLLPQDWTFPGCRYNLRLKPTLARCSYHSTFTSRQLGSLQRAWLV